MSIPSQPARAARTQDLSDAEFAELDELLAATPEPLEPLDAVMLDGYLCGVLVQPMLHDSAEWLPNIFDFDGRPLPENTDADWRARCTDLIQRRHAALNHALVDDGWFDPLVLEAADPDAAAAETAELAEADADDPAASLPPPSRALLPWVAGFDHACACFPELSELDDDAVMAALARLYRHLPASTAQERETVATLDREAPLDSLDAAIEELIACVADLHDMTADDRFRVDTVRRDVPKVGRNDPCPCGSGKKFKHCHGAT